MSATVYPTQTQIFTALKGALGLFGLTATNPAQPFKIVRGQVNRVPEPLGADYLVMWPTMRDPLAFPIDVYSDVRISGSIGAPTSAGCVLTVIDIEAGIPAPGQTIYGTGVTDGCQITRQISGPPGGVGTYLTTPCAAVPHQPLFCGVVGAMLETEITIQADVHGPASADNAARIATLFRRQYGVDAFAAQGIPLAPLYTSDPRQMPFDNAEQQVEERWVVDLCMEADVTVTTTQQFADQVKITPVSVTVSYPLGA